MKHTLSLYALGFLAAAAVMDSCDKMPINGDLDGMWQLTTIQTPEGTRQVTTDRAYLSIQLHLSQWDHHPDRFYAHFNHVGDSIFFYDFAHETKDSEATDDNVWLTVDEMENQKVMDAWGIHNLNARYRVQQLNSSHLTLERKDTILSFRKF